MPPDGNQFDPSALSQDKVFRNFPTAKKIAYLSAMDPTFAGFTPQKQAGYINHVLGNDVQTPFEKSGGDAPTISSTTKDILGTINESASQGLGHNAGEMVDNIKGGARKLLIQNPFDTVTDWVGDKIDDQYGPHGAVAQYDPKTDLGKRALASIPLVGPTAASIAGDLEKGNYSNAALNTGRGLLQGAVAAKVPDAAQAIADIPKATLPARTALAEKIVQPLAYEGVGEAGADTRFGIKPERGIVKEGIWGTRKGMTDKINNRLSLLKPAADNILQTAPGASTTLDATSAINSGIDDAIAQVRRGGPGSEAALEDLRQKLLTNNGPTSGKPLDINNLKTNLQEVASQRGAFKNTVPAEASAASAAGQAASNVRGQVNIAVPEAAPLNERMSDIIDARAGLQRGVESAKGKSAFGNNIEGMTSRALNNTVGSPLVRSGVARILSLGAKEDVPDLSSTPPTFPAFPPTPVVPPRGQTGPLQTGGTGPMITPSQSQVPPTGPGGNVALFPDIPSGQGPSGAGEFPNWPPKVPDWSAVNTAPPVPSAESTIPQETPYGPPNTQGPPPLPPGVTQEQWNAMPTAMRNKFGFKAPAPGSYSPGAATEVIPEGGPLPSSTLPISTVPSTQPPVLPSSGAPSPAAPAAPVANTPATPTTESQVPPTMPPIDRRNGNVGYNGPERRTLLPGVTTQYDLPTPGEQLAQQVRTASAGTPSSFTEGDAMRRIMSNPDNYARFKAADPKTQGQMLIAAKNSVGAQ